MITIQGIKQGTKINCQKAQIQINVFYNKNKTQNYYLNTENIKNILVQYISSTEASAFKNLRTQQNKSELFKVYYQDLENLQTISQLQVFRHKPIWRVKLWPFTFGHFFEEKHDEWREGTSYKVSEKLHIPNYIQTDQACI